MRYSSSFSFLDDGAEKVLTAASDSGFTLISVKDDWNTIYLYPEQD